MLFAYYKIYKEAKRHTKSLQKGRIHLKGGKHYMFRVQKSRVEQARWVSEGEHRKGHINKLQDDTPNEIQKFQVSNVWQALLCSLSH